jgi:regulator of sigma E protease
MSEPFSSSSSAVPEVPPAPPQAPAAPAKHADEKPNPVTMLLVVIGIVAFAAMRPAAAQTAAVFLITLGVLVFVHEWGHYQFARWGGMKVNRFGIGFPPWVYTKRHNGIDYSLGALPIGGMVDIAGLGSEEEMVATTKGETAANPTRATDARVGASVPHGEKQFQEARLGWRFWTLFAGPLMNFIFALVVFVGVYSIMGIPDKIRTTNVIEGLRPGMAATQAGLLQGDRIVAVNGQAATEPRELTKLIRSSGGKPIRVTVERKGQAVQKTLMPTVEEVDRLDGKGKEKAPVIGVEFEIVVDSYKRLGVVQAAQVGAAESLFITQQIFGLLSRAATFNLTKEDKRGVGGPVKIAEAVGQSARKSWQDAVLLAARLSVNLGLLNLLPFPALDGGRILFLGYEGIMKRPVDPRKEGIVHAVGMVMLLAFMLFITLRDVVPYFQRG